MANVYRATFYKRGPVEGLKRVEIRQKWGNHSLAMLDYSIGRRDQYSLPDENVPVDLRWGQAPVNLATFNGYVNHYETLTQDNQTVTVRMFCLGTSKPMNASLAGSWDGTTRSAIAREIAARHRLRSVIHDHPYVVEHWATGTRSDFKALAALADEAGYRFWVDGSTLYFLDPSKILGSATILGTPLVTRQDIRASTVLGGSNVPGVTEPSRRRVQFGLDYRTNEFFQATSGDLDQPAQISSAAANTYSEAQYIADAAERKENDYYGLDLKISGNAKIRPAGTVRVESGRVNNDQAGVWSVNEARHIVTRTDFVTEVMATRGRNVAAAVSAPSQIRTASEAPVAVVRDGRTWEASLQEHLHV